jgi:hypothetical protein
LRREVSRVEGSGEGINATLLLLSYTLEYINLTDVDIIYLVGL